MRFRTFALSLPFALLAGCASDGPAQETPEAPTPETANTGALAALDRARELMKSGDPRDAMLELDEALVLEDPALQMEVQFLRGVATLRMGTEDGNPFFFEDAHTSFEAAAEAGAIAAWSGVARAAWMLYYQSGDPARMEEALDLALRAVEDRGERTELESYLQQTPERTLSEIAFDGYRATKTGALAPSRSEELFEITRSSLENEIRLEPSTAWSWEQLANLYLWEERGTDARTTIERAVTLNPESEALHKAQVRLIETAAGWAEVVTAYEAFVAAHEGNPLGHWFLATAQYEAALQAMLADKSDQSEGFRAAEASFLATRELEPSYAESCKNYEIVCRDGLGWSLFYADDLAGAEAAFWSMEDLQEGGLRWEDPGRLFSGMQSLEFVLAGHNANWEKGLTRGSGVSYSQAFPSLVKAADLSYAMFRYDAEAGNNANNAGYFNRDFAVQLEAQGVRALTGDTPDETRAAELFALSGKHMEQSYEAYQVAARLAPDDARTINDTGLILAYYLQRDLDGAVAYFEEAIRVGLPQLEAGIEDEEQRTMTREAVGDAYQNLGVLELTLRGDAAAAKPHFEESLKYERAPRVAVSLFFLPVCDAVVAGEIPADQVVQAHHWKDLDLEAVRAREAAMASVRAQLAAN